MTYQESKPVKNDERLFRPTKVTVLRPFCVNGVRQEPGSIITLPYHVAMEMQGIGKAERVHV